MEIMFNISDFDTIQEALNLSKQNEITEIYFPDGEYLIDDTLRIYGNTEIILSDNAILKKNNDSYNVMIINGDSDEEYEAYNGNSNITIKGGVLDGNFELNSQSNLMSFGKCENILIEGVTFKNVINNHHLEFSGAKNVVVKDCKFSGYKDITNNKSRSYCEAIQISSHSEAGFPFFGTWDRTPCENITVENCLFENVATGIGSHGGLQGVWDNQIKITNNTFKNCTYAGVRNYKFKNCIISDNIFDNCRIGVLGSFSPTNIKSGREYTESLDDFIISNNTFSNNKDSDICHSSQIFIMGGSVTPDDYAYANKIRIRNNSFNNIEQIAIRLQLCNDVVVSDNTVKGCKSFLYGDFVDYANITNNTVKDATEYGIIITKLNSVPMNLDTKNKFNIITDNFFENIGKSPVSLNYDIESFVIDNLIGN